VQKSLKYGFKPSFAKPIYYVYYIIINFLPNGGGGEHLALGAHRQHNDGGNNHNQICVDKMMNKY